MGTHELAVQLSSSPSTLSYISSASSKHWIEKLSHAMDVLLKETPERANKGVIVDVVSEGEAPA